MAGHKAVSSTKKRNLIKTKKDVWLKNLKEQKDKANRTKALVAAERKKFSGRVPRHVWKLIQKGALFVSLNDDPKFKATVKKCGTPLHHSHHLRTVDFNLTGKGSIKILEKRASNLGVLYKGDTDVKKKFVRVSVTLPKGSQPVHGPSRHYTYKKDGHRLSQAMPMQFKKYYKDKADGYAKYGPNFVHKLKSFKPAKSGKVIMTVKGKKLVFALPDKTRAVKGGEKVIVRGNEFKLRNLQRQQIVFPRKQRNSEWLMESIDGYIEDMVWKNHQLVLTMLVPMKEDYHALSYPFGKAHPPPAKENHHHFSASHLYNVRPMTGAELMKLAGRKGCLNLPPGTALNTTFIGVAGAAAIAAVIAAAGAATVGIVHAVKA